MRVAILGILAIAGTAAAQAPADPDTGVMLREHRAHTRAIALGLLAEARGSDPVRALGRRITRDAMLADEQLSALARQLGLVSFDGPPSPDQVVEDRIARDVIAGLARLSGIDFDRAVLASLGLAIDRELAWIESVRRGPHDPPVLAYLGSLRPMLARERAEAGWLARQRRSAR